MGKIKICYNCKYKGDEFKTKILKPIKGVFEMDGSFYEVHEVNEELFNKIDMRMCITGSDEAQKYLCANQKETNYLKSLGVDAKMDSDWYLIRKAQK